MVEMLHTQGINMRYLGNSKIPFPEIYWDHGCDLQFYKGVVVCLNSGMRFYLFYSRLTFLIYFIVPLILTCFLFTISQSSIASHAHSFFSLVTLSLFCRHIISFFSLTCSLSFFFRQDECSCCKSRETRYRSSPIKQTKNTGDAFLLAGNVRNWDCSQVRLTSSL